MALILALLCSAPAYMAFCLAVQNNRLHRRIAEQHATILLFEDEVAMLRKSLGAAKAKSKGPTSPAALTENSQVEIKQNTETDSDPNDIVFWVLMFCIVLFLHASLFRLFNDKEYSNADNKKNNKHTCYREQERHLRLNEFCYHRYNCNDTSCCDSCRKLDISSFEVFVVRTNEHVADKREKSDNPESDKYPVYQVESQKPTIRINQNDEVGRSE